MKPLGCIQRETLNLVTNEWTNFKRARTADGIWPQMRGLVKRGLIEVRPHQHPAQLKEVMSSKGWPDLFQARLKQETK